MDPEETVDQETKLIGRRRTGEEAGRETVDRRRSCSGDGGSG